MNKTKKSIFQSAMRIFSDKGYDGATMDDIAANAGVAKGTLYYHFKSKEEIFKYIISEGMNVIREQVEDAVIGENNPLNKLKILCKVQLSLVYQNRDFFKVVMSQIWGKELRQLELRESIEGYIKNIQVYLEQAMNQGIIREGEVSFMAYTFFGTLCSAAVYELINQGKGDLEYVIDSLIGYILKGIEI